MQPGLCPPLTPESGAASESRVGIYAKDYDESMRFYTQTMGFKEAFTIKDKDGKPTLTYLQLSKDTFLELALATVERPVGLSHTATGFWPVV